MTERLALCAGMADSRAAHRVHVNVVRLYLAHGPMLVASLGLGNIGVMVAWRVSLHVRTARFCAELRVDRWRCWYNEAASSEPQSW